jgi:hypothetical protein
MGGQWHCTSRGMRTMNWEQDFFIYKRKGSYYMGIKLFNYLPLNLKKLYKDIKRFKLKLAEFLSHHSFYTLDEYIEYSNWKD